MPSERFTSRALVVLAVCGAWVVVSVIIAVQATLGSTLMGGMGGQQVAFAAAARTAFIQNLPWIPVTLGAIALTLRYPLRAGQWARHLPVHLVAALAFAFLANVLVVLGFWWVGGRFDGFQALVRAGALWATIRLHLALLIYAGILGITQTIVMQRRARARELQLARVEGQLARAQVEALNAQIRPHFLFNTLHTIGQLWRSGRSEDADAVLDHLGALFHKVQTSTARTAIPLSEELALVREYLAIEQARHPDRLRISVEAAPDTLDIPVPPLILQPIVENAIRHGIAAVSDAGRLDVRASRENGALRLTVSDDGPGPQAHSPQPGSGTGLRNTRERLAQLYGERGSLRIEAGSPRGTRVLVEIPVSADAPATADFSLRSK